MIDFHGFLLFLNGSNHNSMQLLYILCRTERLHPRENPL